MTDTADRASSQAAIHPVAAVGYARASAAYEAVRPAYPAAAVDLLADELGIRAGRRVLDLAAGTGKLTMALAGLGATMIAVEPVAAMREQLLRVAPQVEALAGRAEDIPLPDKSVDAVVVGMAFHWFDAPAAVVEIQRVLVPGGGLGVVWYAWDRSVAWVDAVQACLRAHARGVPQQQTSRWREELADSGLFGQLTERTFLNLVEADLTSLLTRFSTSSFIAALSSSMRESVLAEVRGILAAHGIGSDGTFVVPYRVHVVWARRSGAPRHVEVR